MSEIALKSPGLYHRLRPKPQPASRAVGPKALGEAAVLMLRWWQEDHVVVWSIAG
jgi:hypothetical protein